VNVLLKPSHNGRIVPVFRDNADGCQYVLTATTTISLRKIRRQSLTGSFTYVDEPRVGGWRPVWSGSNAWRYHSACGPVTLTVTVVGELRAVYGRRDEVIALHCRLLIERCWIQRS